MSVAILPIGHHTQTFVGRAAQRQANLKVRAGFAVAHQLHGAAVRLHAFRDDRQPDTRAAHGSALLPAALEERFENPFGIIRVHAGATVADVDDEIVTLHAGADVDRAAG